MLSKPRPTVEEDATLETADWRLGTYYYVIIKNIFHHLIGNVSHSHMHAMAGRLELLVSVPPLPPY